MKKKDLIENLQIGDIILVNSKNKINSFAQKLGTFKFIKNYEFTHVILSLSKDLFIESNLKIGVDVFDIKDLIERFLTIYDEKFLVIRNKNIQNNSKFQELIFTRAEYYYKQKYNSIFISPKKQRAKSYCSEFIANVYKDVGINIKDKKLYPTWPIHIYELLTKDEWLNVTEEYKDYFVFYKNLYNGIDDFNKFTYALLFKRFHNINDINRILHDFTNRYKKLDSFYNTLYPSENIESYYDKDSFKEKDLLIDSREILEERDTITEKLKLCSSLINNYIEEFDINQELKDEDIKVSWKDEKSVKEIRKKRDEKIRRLHKGLNDLYKHNLWINSTIFYNVCLFEYLDNKGKNILKEKYFRYLENNYSLINLDEILKESQKVVDRSKSYIKDEDLFLATINLHTLCFLLTLDILEKYQDYKEKISLIMGEKI